MAHTGAPIDDPAMLQALAAWVLEDRGASKLRSPHAAAAYKRMGDYLLARVREGHFASVAGLNYFARILEAAIRSDIGEGAEPEAGQGMLAFWDDARSFVAKASRARQRR